MSQTKPQAPAAAPAPSPVPAPREPIAFVVRRDFRQIVNSAMLSFTSGEALTNLTLAAKLMERGAPLDPVYDEDDVVRCPHCRKLFTAEQVESGDE